MDFYDFFFSLSIGLILAAILRIIYPRFAYDSKWYLLFIPLTAGFWSVVMNLILQGAVDARQFLICWVAGVWLVTFSKLLAGEDTAKESREERSEELQS